jgi:hypothetical protein
MALRFPIVLSLAGLALLVAPGIVSGVSEATLGVRTTYLGVETFEPTLGADPSGALFYSTTPVRGVAIGFGTGVHRSLDGGLTWSDVSPRIAGVRVPPETNDPYVYVDPGTGRVFQFAMAPILVCSMMSWTDDQGASWLTNPRGCWAQGWWDHQTMVASTPRTLVATPAYPHILTMCTNGAVDIACGRSLDGGLSWGPTGSPPSVAGASLHGHIKAAPDGTLYLPRNSNYATVFVSTNDGLTWTPHLASAFNDSPGGADPTVAVDDAGNAYFAWIDAVGHVKLSISKNGGATWSAPIQASPPGVTANLPALAAGADGRIVLAYAGTADLANGYQTPGYGTNHAQRWVGYMTISTDATSASPTFQTVTTSAATDPLVRGPCGPGRCPGMVDFIDVIVAPDGNAYAAFVDACTGLCASDPARNNNASQALVATVTGGPSLR